MITKEKYEEVLKTLADGYTPDVYGVWLTTFDIIKPSKLYIDTSGLTVRHTHGYNDLYHKDLYYTKEEAALVLMRELFTKLDLEMKNE